MLVIMNLYLYCLYVCMCFTETCCETWLCSDSSINLPAVYDSVANLSKRGRSKESQVNIFIIKVFKWHLSGISVQKLIYSKCL